jgi:predicted AAA+ superfamily ATPase
LPFDGKITKKEMKYISRIAESTIKKHLKVFPVVGVTGPRQSGKSTMLINTLDYEYVTFDDLANVNLFYEDPERFLNTYKSKVIFDEVQKVPEIFNYIKLTVDRKLQKPGQFVLTGSSQFNFIKNITESLSGRISLLSLLPFQYKEVPTNKRAPCIYKGSYPRLVTRNFRLSENWYSSYLTTYIERDLRSLVNIGDINDFYNLIRIIASYCSKILNISEISNITGIPVTTLKRWISVLEASYIIFLLRPYYKNISKRYIKSPKIFFYDTGLVGFLTGITTRKIFERGPMYGAIFENYIISEIIKNNFHLGGRKRFYYYRTSSGNEIDLIEEDGRKVKYIEMKAAYTLKPELVKNLLREKPAENQGILIYNGESRMYSRDINIVNFEEYLESV